MSAKKNTQVKKAAKQPEPAANSIDFKEVAKVAGILTTICLVIALALAGTNLLTAEKIAQKALETKAETCLEVLPADSAAVDEFRPIGELFDGYDDYDVYLAIFEGRVVGAAITVDDEKGYGGAIQVMTGIDSTGRVCGVRILDHSETAGMGANAAKPKFLDQFVTAPEELQQEEYKVSKDGGTIDAVTSATISSRAVTRAVNDALEIFRILQADGVIGAQVASPAMAVSDVTPTDAAAAQVSDNSNAAGGTENE